MSITHAANPGRHSVAAAERRPVRNAAPGGAESLPESVWEPACGPGSIVGILRATGHRVYATDDLRGKRLLDVCTEPGHLAGEAATRGA